MADRRRGARRDPVQLAFLVLLLTRLYEQYRRLPLKPGVITGALVLGMILIHLAPELLPPLHDCCISSRAVVAALQEGGAGGFAWLFGRRTVQERMAEVARRLVLSTLLHVDELHLYYNMGSLLLKGALLEQRMGTEWYVAFLAYSVLASGVLAVALGSATDALGLSWPTLRCAVGFSGVLYAMSAVLMHHARGEALVHGLWRVPRRHALWLEAIVSSVLHSNVSLLGHLGGAAAGALWCAAPSAAAAAWAGPRRRGGGGGATRFYGGGRLGGATREPIVVD